MKKRYKFLIVILLLWLGMSYEGSRNGATPTTPPTSVSRQNMTLEERIRAYELGLIDGVDDDYSDLDNRYYAPRAANQGNLIARTGRNIGNAIQTFVREALRGIVRFFDGIIS